MDTYPLYAAVYGRLVAHASSSPLTWAREDQDPALPFGRVVTVTEVDGSAKDTDRLDVVIQLDYFAGDGRTAREGLGAADAAVMDASTDEMTGGYDVSASGYAVVGQPVRLDGGVITDPPGRDEGDRPAVHAFRRYRFLYLKTS